ncbi:hypothetical protein [Methylomagnum sp.]
MAFREVGGERVSLAALAPLAISEAMRDVDLLAPINQQTGP